MDPILHIVPATPVEPYFNGNGNMDPSFEPPSSNGYLLSPESIPAMHIRRAKSDSGSRPKQHHQSHLDDLRSSNALYQPTSEMSQDFLSRQFLHPSETVQMLIRDGGHYRRASSGNRVAREPGSWYGALSPRSSPYPSPHVSPQHVGLELPMVAKSYVTTGRTANASRIRRKQDANFMCPIPSCGSTFTRSFNLKGRPYFLFGYVTSFDSNLTCRAHALAQRGEAFPVQVARMWQELCAAARLQATRAAAHQLQAFHV